VLNRIESCFSSTGSVRGLDRKMSNIPFIKTRSSLFFT